MNKVRILFITPGPLLGGGATVSLYRLIKHLDRQRYEPIVLCHECGPTNPYVIKLEELGVKVLALRNDQVDTSLGRKLTSVVNLCLLDTIVGAVVRRLDRPCMLLPPGSIVAAVLRIVKQTRLVMPKRDLLQRVLAIMILRRSIHWTM